MPLEGILATIDITGKRRHLAHDNLANRHTFFGDLLLNLFTVFLLLIN